MTTASVQEPFVFRPTAGHARRRGGDPLVDQTRREISQIVREIASLTKQNVPADQFLSLLCDRTLRAMAAEGIVIWKRTQGDQQRDGSSNDSNGPLAKPFQPVARLGCITDQVIPTPSLAAHQCLLREVVAEAVPVVVPATPSAVEPDVPANPMEYPAAVVPIAMLSTFEGAFEATQYIIEVFLEPVGGVSTQRGYLRFLAQIADLAGEFLRADQLRELVAARQLNERVESAIETFRCFDKADPYRAHVVDTIAGLFNVDRVAWCDLSRKSPLVAVSFTDHFDPTSDAAQSILSEAMTEPTPRFMTQASRHHDPAGFCTIAVVDGGSQSPTDRLVLLRSDSSSAESDQSLTLTEAEQKELTRLARHATDALERLQQQRRTPFGRLRPNPISETGSLFWKMAKSMMVATIVALVLLCPVPDRVAGTANARPKRVQRLHASRDAIVETIHVAHGESVEPGQLLMTLTDPELEEQITSLQGRRAVLAEQQIRLTQAMVENSSGSMAPFENLRGQRGITSEQIHSIDAQLELLHSVHGSLVLRADRQGKVDAWQLNQRLNGKPVRRGDPLIAVTSLKSPWLLHVEVDQRRIGKLRVIHQADRLTANVTLDDMPLQSLQATVLAFGPSVPDAKHGSHRQEPPQSTVLLELEPSSTTLEMISGAPAKVTFRCGTEPLAAKLFGDLWRSLRYQAALHFGIGIEHDLPKEP